MPLYDEDDLEKIHANLKKSKKALAEAEAIQLFEHYDYLLKQLQKLLKGEITATESAKRLTPALAQEYNGLAEKINLIKSRKDSASTDLLRLQGVKKRNQNLSAIAWGVSTVSVFLIAFGISFAAAFATTATAALSPIGGAVALLLISIYLANKFEDRSGEAKCKIISMSTIEENIKTDEIIMDQELDQAIIENQKSIPEEPRRRILRDVKLIAEKDIAKLEIALAEINQSTKKTDETPLFQVGNHSLFAASQPIQAETTPDEAIPFVPKTPK